MKNSMLAIMIISAACLSIVLPANADNLVIKGSTTVLPLAQAAAEEFMKSNPDIQISVSGGGSGNGIKALLDGSTDIADSSRFIKDSEVAAAVQNSRYPVPHQVALDCVVPIVHPSNPVTNLTLEQLKDIYTGKVSNWKELGRERYENRGYFPGYQFRNL